jgi:hypothetical protein
MGNATTAVSADRSALLRIETTGPLPSVRLNRPVKPNAPNDGIILTIQESWRISPCCRRYR